MPSTLIATLEGVVVPRACRHCGDSISRARASEESERSQFCCDGCLNVFTLLNRLNLASDFYALQNSRRSNFKPNNDLDEDYSALDLPPFRARTGESATLDFFLEGIHCTACVWLLERLPEIHASIESARVDLGRAIVRVKIIPSGKFEDVARVIVSLGYRPHPVLSEDESEQRLVQEDRKTLRRMGVAAFAAMNVMLYSISLYTGVEGRYAVLFRVLSLLVAFPALTYSAYPFYRSAFSALKAKRVSIDLPISMAFIFGFLESLRQAHHGTNLLYLDSLTSLVFLMLLSRYVLGRLERAELSKSGLLQVLLPSRVLRLKSAGILESVRANEIRIGDVLRVKAGSRIPVDGRVSSGTGDVDLSILTGESNPIRVKDGESVFAGSTLASGEIDIRVQSRGTNTRLGEIQNRLEEFAPKKNARTVQSDRWAQIFLSVVIGLAAALLFAFGFENSAEAFRRSLSLLIIACPCALALATPLTLARAHRLAAANGILLRSPEVLERLSQIRTVIFDKTGTLTSGTPKVTSWLWASPFSDEERRELESIAYSLELTARHPYGRAIRAHLENRVGVRKVEISERETAGFGMEGIREGTLYQIGREEVSDRKTFSGVVFRRQGKIIARISVRDELRPEALTVIEQLKAQGLSLEILSGDSVENVDRVARTLQIEKYSARLTPEEKQARCENTPDSTLVIGDGINDALMMKSALIGVAFNRGEGASIESTLSGAEVAITHPDLRNLVELFDVGTRYRGTLTRNAVFSAVYNVVGASFAVAGVIHPLVAAIAMPLSALTVFLSTLHGLKLRKRVGSL